MANKKFVAKINDQFKIALSEEEALPFQFTRQGHLHSRKGADSVKAVLCSENFFEKQYSFKINGSFYTVTLQGELDILIEEMGLAAGENSVQNELTAPMPGLITEVVTSHGATVKEGDPLLVLEAMKMENTLSAKSNGIVKAIHVKVSDTVEKGMVLIEFESNEQNQ